MHSTSGGNKVTVAFGFAMNLAAVSARVLSFPRYGQVQLSVM